MRSTLLFLLVSIGYLFILTCSPNQVLSPNFPRVIRDQINGESHSYRIETAKGSWIHGVLHREGLNAILKLKSDQKKVWSMSSVTPGEGQEHFWIGDSEDELYLEITATSSYAEGGSYELALNWTSNPSEEEAFRTFMLQQGAKSDDSPSFTRVLKFWQDRNNKSMEALTRFQLAQANLEKGDPSAAVQVLSDMPSGLDPRWQAFVTYCKAGLFYEELNDIGEAERTYEEALLEANNANYPALAGLIGNDLGYMLHKNGRYHDALLSFKQAFGSYRHAPLQGKIARVHIARAKTHNIMGNSKFALKDLSRALALAIYSGDKLQEARAHFEIGWALYVDGRYEEAIPHLKHNLDYRLKTGNIRAAASVRDRLGSVMRELERLDEALVFHQKAAEYYRNAGEALNTAHVEINIAKILFMQGKLILAREMCEKVLPVFRELQKSQMESALLLAAQIALSLDGPEHALPFLEEANLAIDQIYHSSRSRHLRRAIGHSRFLYLAFHADILMQLGRRDEAFMLLDRGRARILRERLGRPLQAEKTERDRQSLKQAIISDKRAGKGENLTKHVLDLDLISPIDLDKTSPSYSFDQIKQTLLSDDRSVIWFFALDENNSRLWSIERDRTEVFSLPPRNQIDSLVETVLRWSSKSQTKTGRKRWKQAISGMGEMLREPISRLPGNKRLIIVADGSLHYAPFCALPIIGNSGSSNRYLISDRPVVFVPSLSYAVARRLNYEGSQAQSGSLSIFGDAVFSPEDFRVNRKKFRRPEDSWFENLPRLPYSKYEALAVSAYAPGQSQLLLGFEASRNVFLKNDWSHFQVLHMSCHGLFDPHPDLAGLVLSQFNSEGDPQNGFVTTMDIVDMELPLEMAVLSACRTSFGEDKNGQGLWGFSSALMEAGCARVITSNWNVQDKPTAHLFEQFYHLLYMRKLPPDEALRGAQLFLLENSRWRSPYYWAAWKLQGDWEPLP